MKKRIDSIDYPKCILCSRGSPGDLPLLSGECFVLIPCQINDQGSWIPGSWHVFCGQCFDSIINRLPIKDGLLGKVDFQNLFQNIPVTIFKDTTDYKVEFKNY